MSITGARLALADADRIAAGILAQIDGEAHVVGSVRRRKPTVGDIEIMVHREAKLRLPVTDGLWPGQFAGVKGGLGDWRYWQLRHHDGWMLDLYRFDDLNRGSIMLIRTGPAEFSKLFVMKLRDRRLVHADGYVRTACPNGELAACPDERTAFDLAGMAWVEPEER